MVATAGDTGGGFCQPQDIGGRSPASRWVRFLATVLLGAALVFYGFASGPAGAADYCDPAAATTTTTAGAEVCAIKVQADSIPADATVVLGMFAMFTAGLVAGNVVFAKRTS